MPFVNKLVVMPDSGSDWRLVKPLMYVTNEGEAITVPAGFICDLASIPPIARPLFPVNGDWTEAAVIHDWLYDGKIGSRERADEIFLEAMEDLGVSWWRRRIMYRAVRLGGWLYWRD